MTHRKIDPDSLMRIAKKISFPAILAIPLFGGIIAASWSAAETAQAVADPAGLAGPALQDTAKNLDPVAPARFAPQGSRETHSEVAAPVDSAEQAAPAVMMLAAATTDPAPTGVQQAELPPADKPAGDSDAAALDPADSGADSSPATIVRKVTVASGDTLMRLLTDAGADRGQAYQAVSAMESVFSPRDLMPGQELKIAFADLGDSKRGPLLSITFSPNRERDIEVSRSNDSEDFFAESIDRPLARQLAYAQGTIENSLSVAASNRNVPSHVVAEAIHAFSYDVDFQREVQKGDSFEFFYEIFVDEKGDMVRSGDLLYAAMTLSGTRTELYYYQRDDGSADFYTPEGTSVRRSLMRTPIDGARLSSTFGMRKHPILGYTRMHRGVDFAAPRGTPIYAAGNGVVDYAGRRGGYGRYVRLRHGSTYMTAYAHMRAFAKGIRKGARVKQGQVIGYVGTSGRSTGPHLHYEVLVNGKQVNPLKVTLPRGDKLKASEMKDFAEARAEIDRERKLAQNGVVMVQRACAENGVLEQGSNGGDC